MPNFTPDYSKSLQTGSASTVPSAPSWSQPTSSYSNTSYSTYNKMSNYQPEYSTFNALSKEYLDPKKDYTVPIKSYTETSDYTSSYKDDKYYLDVASKKTGTSTAL